MQSSMYQRYNAALNPAGDAPGREWLLVFAGSKMLIIEEGDRWRIPRAADFAGSEPGGDRHYLGELDGYPCWCLPANEEDTRLPGLRFVELRATLDCFEEELFLLAGRAFQIVNWHGLTRYCGRCGNGTEQRQQERAKSCPACGAVFYPRLSPAVIVAVYRDETILLANNKKRRPGWYSVLAGFVDPGESFEDCVKREIREEVGIEVKNITYFGSQPWPFPDSLMVGFTAEYAGGDIIVDDVEISHAAWFGFDSLPPDRPITATIAGRLIEHVASGRRTSAE